MKSRYRARMAAIFFGLLPVLLSGIPTHGAPALPYQPDREVAIETEVAEAAPTPSISTRTWRIRTSREEGSVRLAIYTAKADVPFCTLSLPGDGAVGRIVLTEPPGGRQRSSDNGLFVLPGHPAPVNILPVEQVEAEKFYEEKRTAGGRLFVKRYRVFRTEVTPETALQQGWIPKESSPPDAGPGPADTRPFLLLTVEDDSRTPVVRQLWREGDSWWIYEETPFKRSRRLE